MIIIVLFKDILLDILKTFLQINKLRNRHFLFLFFLKIDLFWWTIEYLSL